MVFYERHGAINTIKVIIHINFYNSMIPFFFQMVYSCILLIILRVIFFFVSVSTVNFIKLIIIIKYHSITTKMTSKSLELITQNT